MSQLAQMVLESLGVKRFHRPSRALMQKLAALDQQGVVGDLLRQRMLECVLNPRERWLFIDELACLQIGKHSFQLRPRRGGNPPNQVKRRLLAHHRQCLQQIFLLRGQAVDTRAARIPCTVGGRCSCESGRVALTAPLRTRAPSSNNARTISSIKNGLPSVRSSINRLNGASSAASPSSVETISAALSRASASNRNCV